MSTNSKRYNLKGKSIHELEGLFAELGEPSYRAEQAFRRINKELAASLDSFSNFPLALRERLKNYNSLPRLELKHSSLESKKLSAKNTRDSNKPNASRNSLKTEESHPTEKLIFALEEKARQRREVESVWIVSERRRTLCISSQAGCSLNCSFCATGTLPFKGNLESWEILDQVYEFIRRRHQERLTNVVFMGMGEPLHNYDNVMRAARILNHPKGLHLGASHITISTAGVVPAIERFIREREPFNLALSLNHPQNEGRSKIMDINRKYPLEQLLKVSRKFTKELNRRITFEYVMIPGVNMDPQSVRKLIKIGHSVRCRINLIPLNTNLQSWQRPKAREIYNFQSQLLDAGLSVFNRNSPGLEIHAACGMLALKHSSEYSSKHFS